MLPGRNLENTPARASRVLRRVSPKEEEQRSMRVADDALRQYGEVVQHQNPLWGTAAQTAIRS
jgi:hypothetical protein